NPRASRIATVLGLRNEDINQFKNDANGLFNFLMDKLSAYQTAGVAAQNTWAGLWSNTKDLASQALGQALTPFFEAVKYELKSISDDIYTIDNKTKTIKWNPEFLESVTEFKEGITSIIAEVYRLGMLLDKVGGGYKAFRANIYGALGFKNDSETEFKKNEAYRERYMKSEQALQDMAMRESGFKPMTADIDKAMRAATDGKKKYEQSVISVGNRDDGTYQTLRYYRELGDQKKPGYQPNPIRDTDEKAEKKLEKLREQWAKVSGDLSSDINQHGLDDFGKKIDEINNKAADLSDKYRNVPGALAEITTWAETETSQAFSDQLSKQLAADNAAGKARLKNREDLEKRITAVNASELNIRLNQVRDEAVEQQKLADAAYDRSNPEGARNYQDAIIAIEKAATEKRKKINAEYYNAVREAQINAELSALDLAEAEGARRIDSLAERIRLINELIDSEEEHLSGMQKTGNEQAWQTQLDKINAYKLTLAGLKKELDMSEPLSAIDLSMKKLLEKWSNQGQQMADIATTTATSMQQAFSDIFFDAFQGRLKSAGDYITAFVNSVNRAISNYLANMASAGLINMVGKAAATLLTSAAGSAGASSSAGYTGAGLTVSGNTTGNYITAKGFHRGGADQEATFYRMVPTIAFSAAPHFHGGFAPDEYPAVLQRGESVFTPGQMKAMGLLASRGDNGNAVPNITINIENQSGTQIEAEQRNSVGDYITAFVNGVNRAISNYLANMETAGLINMVKQAATTLAPSLFPAASGAGTIANSSSISAVSAAAIKHDGGMGNEAGYYRIVPSEIFVNAPRLHSGIGPGEKAAIIRNEESVLTPGQMKAMGLLASRGGNAVPDITINIENQSGTQIEAEQRNSVGDYITAFVNGVNRAISNYLANMETAG
ncbi:MAG: hypothetical protein WC354_08035, partial [Candidatus Omnitrophota bacterium]